MVKRVEEVENNLEPSRDQQQLQQGIQDGIKKALNSQSKGYLLIYSLIKYIDQQYQKHFKVKSEEEIENVLQEVVGVFQLVNDKDIFMNSLQKSVARRLIQASSVHQTREELLVTLLRQQVGGVYTSKLHKMFQDLQCQQHIHAQYLHYLQTHHSSQHLVQVEPKILTQGIWPIQSKITSQFPPLLLQTINRYNQFYSECFPNRRLEWVSELGVVDVRFNLDEKRRKELLVSSIQMIVLDLFNNNDQVDGHAMVKATGMQWTSLVLQLIPLLQLAILLPIHNQQPSIHAPLIHHFYSVNLQFTHSNFKIKVPTLKKKAIKNSHQQIQSQQFLERKINIEVQIIRIMKRRKQIQHQQLCAEIAEVMSNQFVAEQQLIKSCIESLINREYIERQNKDTYIYLP